MHHLSPTLRFLVNHWPALFGILAIPHLACLMTGAYHRYNLTIGVLTIGYIAACFVASWKRNLWAVSAMPAFLAATLVVRMSDSWSGLSGTEKVDLLSYATREVLTVTLACFLFVIFDLWKTR